MGLYIEDAKKKTIRHYNTTPQLEKSIETMLQDIKNMVWSETGEGYVVEYKDIDESQKALAEACDSFKKDYKNHLKAAMVAMLSEIQLEIEEIPNSYEHKPIGTYDYCSGAENERKVNLEIIQQKINALRGEEDDK